MNDAINNFFNNKSIDTYKILEDRYLILKRYLNLLINENRVDIQNIECILKALDDNPIETNIIKLQTNANEVENE